MALAVVIKLEPGEARPTYLLAGIFEAKDKRLVLTSSGKPIIALLALPDGQFKSRQWIWNWISIPQPVKAQKFMHDVLLP